MDLMDPYEELGMDERQRNAHRLQSAEAFIRSAVYSLQAAAGAGWTVDSFELDTLIIDLTRATDRLDLILRRANEGR